MNELVQIPVLTAFRDGHWLAIPAGAVGRVEQVPCSPPPPWAYAWVDGLAVIDGKAALVIAPFGAAFQPPATRSVTVVMSQTTTTSDLMWGFAVERIGTLTKATPTAHQIDSTACPRTWLNQCVLADGMSAALVDVTAIQHTLADNGGST